MAEQHALCKTAAGIIGIKKKNQIQLHNVNMLELLKIHVKSTVIGSQLISATLKVG